MISTPQTPESFGDLMREVFRRELFRQMHVISWRKFDRILFYSLVLLATAALIINVAVFVTIILGV